MKNLILFLIIYFPSITLFSQDIIILKDGTEINSIVKEVNQDNIKYLKFSSKEGPIYTKSISDIFMVKYQNGEKDIFNSKDNINRSSNQLFKLGSGELITLYLKESVSSKHLTNGTIIKFAVKEPVISNNNKVVIASNTPVNGKVTQVREARWAGQKGELTIQINSIKAVDGTNIPVYYNLNNQGDSRSTEAIGVGLFLFWPVLLMKGEQASIEAGTEILVETMSEITFDDSNFDEYNKEDKSISSISQIESGDNGMDLKDTNQKKTVLRPKKKDYDRHSEYKKALKKYYYDREYYEPKKDDYDSKSDYKKAMKAYYEHEDYFQYYE
tara:strand:+ start:516 stop:1496 length:981 start_codon:yes stop_codon:yes gene_type:complete